MIAAIASGKGGTGKTTLAVNLARVLGRGVRLLDCDVEEPNAHLFLRGTLRERHVVTLPVPAVDAARCDGCGECSRFCQYRAIAVVGKTPLVFADLCHGCGGCMRACPRQALHEASRRIGVVETLDAGGVTLIQGRLDVGVAAVPPLIRAVRATGEGAGDTIVDAPPGTSCAMLAAVRRADVVVLVTEPTPFGLHDLKLAVAGVRQLGIPFGVVINRVGIGDGRVHAFCEQERIPLLLALPDERRIAEAYSRGELIVDALPNVRHALARLWEKAAELGRFHPRSTRARGEDQALGAGR